jgi:predicted dehydrogenase
MPKTISVGVIGTGWSASTQAWCLRTLQFTSKGFAEKIHIKLDSVLSHSIARGESFAKTYGFEHYTDSEENFFRRNLDLVIVASHNYTHRHYTIRALERGSHVVIEKPLATSYEEAQEIVRKAQASGRFGTVCFVARFVPAFIYARSLMSKGVLGSLTMFRAVSAHAKHAYEDTPFEWRMSKALAGGGVFTDLGIHLIDLAEYLTNMRIKRILGKGYIIVSKRKDPFTGQMIEIDAEDMGIALVEMENTSRWLAGSLEASKVCPGFEEQMRIEIYGNEGGLRASLNQPHEVYVFTRSSGNVEKRVIGFNDIYKDLLWPPSKSYEGWTYAYLVLLKGFIEFLANVSDSYSPTLEEGLRAQKILDAYYRSNLQGGSWVEVD